LAFEAALHLVWVCPDDALVDDLLDDVQDDQE
jgi:hypothetical protein